MSGDGAFRTVDEPVQSEPKVPNFRPRQQVTLCVEAMSVFGSVKAGCLNPWEIAEVGSDGGSDVASEASAGAS